MSVVPPSPVLSPADLLALLRARGGAVFAARLTYLGRPKGEYLLTARGDLVRVGGPDGTTRDVDEDRYLTVFRGYAWADARPTGRLTDLGPLFGESA
ncbi:hypothetical protein [Deinococcus pimensis]|uniref:hypothetical protein n=1 Tax=Deinococcus pimensis TaxID=309888 RepID=UPI0004BB506F|nr:hypothetical protein [Deinococcus pimensis]